MNISDEKMSLAQMRCVAWESYVVSANIHVWRNVGKWSKSTMLFSRRPQDTEKMSCQRSQEVRRSSTLYASLT